MRQNSGAAHEGRNRNGSNSKRAIGRVGESNRKFFGGREINDLSGEWLSSTEKGTPLAAGGSRKSEPCAVRKDAARPRETPNSLRMKLIIRHEATDAVQ